MIRPGGVLRAGGAMGAGLRVNGIRFAVIAVLIVAYLPFAPVRLHDLRAFYCAGRAVTSHVDPYREHPLHDCERMTTAPAVSVDADDVTVPAPLPGYALAPFALLARLPFEDCVLIWVSASLAALTATVAMLRRLIDVPVEAIGVGVCIPAALVAIPLGQTTPLVGAAIAACALALVHGRRRCAALAALATSLDPPIALALAATLFVSVPGTRVTLLVGTALLAVLSVAVIGVDANLEYLGAVLHAHALGNVAERSQFSTTHFAWVAGLDRNAAIVLGDAWYGASALTGIWIALRLRRTNGDAALALVPPAFAVFGGLYVHFSQLVLAIPAFLLAAQPFDWKRPRFAVAIFLLAVPWLALAAFPPFAIALVALGTLYGGSAQTTKIGLRLGLSSAGLLLLFFGMALCAIHPSFTSFHSAVTGNPLADVAWSDYVAWRDPHPSALFLLLQVPTVVCFVMCVSGVLRQGLRAGRRRAVTAA